MARRAASERWRLASETAELGVWEADLVTGLMHWSPKFLSIVGLEPNTPPRAERFASLLEPEDRLDFESMFDAVTSGEVRSRLRGMYRVVRARDGEPRWLLVIGLVLLDQAGKSNRMIGTIQDVTEMRSVEERARYAAFHDSLTGLSSRNTFIEQTQSYLDRGGEGVALFVFDLEDFREINETLGHDAGDDLLAAIGQRLSAFVGTSGAAARLGADEFAVAVPGQTNEADPGELGAKLTAAIAEPLAVADRTLEPRAKMGMSLSLVDGKDAKASGERVPLQFQQSMRQPIIARVYQELQARQALSDDRILPFYQPKVVLATGKPAGFEALLRWVDPRKGLQTPDSIEAAFRHPSLVSEIGRRMLDRVLNDLRHWLDAGHDVGHVALNVSEFELRRVDFVDAFLGRLTAFGVPVERMQVEVTEPALLGKDGYAVTVALKVLQAEGVKVALDDFGVGFTSLTLLREHPIDTIKMDRSFTRELGRSKDALAVARAAIKLGQDLGKTVVAVGLATPEQRDLVFSCGCAIGQGFMLGRPMTAEHVPSFLTQDVVD
jgi:diguanylate cyclase (GGDEF)-like protein/PAS domain S-box-containing protein